MTIMAILTGVSSVPAPGPLAGGAAPADGFAGLLAAALPMPPTLVEPETATVLPPDPAVEAQATSADGMALPAGTAIPIIDNVPGAVAAPPARVSAPGVASPGGRIPLRLQEKLSGASAEDVAVTPAARRGRGMPKLAPPPVKNATFAQAAPMSADTLANIYPPPVANPLQSVPVPVFAAPPTVSGLVSAPMIRTDAVAVALAPEVAAPVALTRVGAGRADASEAATGANSLTVAPLEPRRVHMVPVALDDRLREAPFGMAGAPAPAGPPIPSPGIAPPPAPRFSPLSPTIVLSASPKGLLALPAAIGAGADNVAAGPTPPPPGLLPVRAAVSAEAPTAAATMPVIVDDRAPVAASTPVRPVVTQMQLSQLFLERAAPSADAAAAAEAGSPGAGAVPAVIAQGGPTLVGADRTGMGAAVARVAAAPTEPAQSSGDDRRDGRDRPIRGRAGVAGLSVPVDPGRPQPIPVAFAPPMAAERAAASAAPPASMPGAAAPDRAATAMTVTTEQLGAVSIGVDDDAGHLRVRLSGSALAMDTVAAQAPRLVAELAATGVRLGSLDIAGRADSVVAPASSGDATSDRRTTGGQAGGDALMGGGTDARGAPSGDGRARSAAGIAALARGGIAGDPAAAPRFSPSDRYA